MLVQKVMKRFSQRHTLKVFSHMIWRSHPIFCWWICEYKNHWYSILVMNYFNKFSMVSTFCLIELFSSKICCNSVLNQTKVRPKLFGYQQHLFYIINAFLECYLMPYPLLWNNVIHIHSPNIPHHGHVLSCYQLLK